MCLATTAGIDLWLTPIINDLEPGTPLVTISALLFPFLFILLVRIMTNQVSQRRD